MAKRKKQYVIREPEQIEALVSPFRHHLLRTLSSIGPASVRTLARAVGRSPESLYYHLHALEDAGLRRGNTGLGFQPLVGLAVQAAGGNLDQEE